MSNKNSSHKGTDLMSINLEGLVQGNSPQKLPPADNTFVASPISDNYPNTDNVNSTQWNRFLSILDSFRTKKIIKERKTQFYIEERVIEVLAGCDIYNSRATDIINSILLSFVEENKANFRKFLRPLPTLIKE